MKWSIPTVVLGFKQRVWSNFHRIFMFGAERTLQLGEMQTLIKCQHSSTAIDFSQFVRITTCLDDCLKKGFKMIKIISNRLVDGLCGLGEKARFDKHHSSKDRPSFVRPSSFPTCRGGHSPTPLVTSSWLRQQIKRLYQIIAEIHACIAHFTF